MKKLLLFAAFLILFAVPVLAQQLGDPPLPVPDYNPKGWKEYSFEKDKVKFSFRSNPSLSKQPRERSQNFQDESINATHL